MGRLFHNIKASLVVCIPLLLNLNSCSQKMPSSFECSYTFFDCPDRKVESTYESHRARIVRFSDSNNLPAPYDKEFYAIDLFPDGNTSLSSRRKIVLPCGDLPVEFREDGLLVSVSGKQLECEFFPVTHPQIKLAGNNFFIVIEMKKIQ